MKKLPEQSRDRRDTLARLVPYAGIAALLVASYFVLFQPGLGYVNTAQAQVNVGTIGEQITETVTGAAAEHGGEVAEAQQELEEPGTTEVEAEEPEFVPPAVEDLPEGESVEPATDEEAEEVYVGPGSRYYISSEGLGGTRITELTRDEFREFLLMVPDLQGSEDLVDQLLPILLRFQTMVSPPEPQPEPGEEAWLSGTRRYSPFDPVGVQPPVPTRAARAIPPFQPLEDLGRERPEDRITAQQVASTLQLVGVMGEPGRYVAIIAGFGEERVLSVGDEIGSYGEYTFVVTEIDLNSVRLEREGLAGDTGVIFFGERLETSGISEMSISY